MNATPPAHGATHEVFNQAPPLTDYNLYGRDVALREAVAREGSARADAWLGERGAELGAPAMQALAADANRHTPRLQSFDSVGNRRDTVEFHPAYHLLMGWLARHGMSASPWDKAAPDAHVQRAALFLMYAQVEDGTLCPATMTFAAVPCIAREPDLAARWLPKLLARDYDHRFLPVEQKRGVTIGMGMTEKQGGSDVRTNTTRAEPEGGADYHIVGHKWFFSAPMCDAFLILAQAPRGLTCFMLPRFKPDGSVNAIRLERLKDKLGDRSNASAEVEFHGAYAQRVGDEGRGIPTILEMGTYCRLDCALGSAGLIRGAVTQALHHAQHRAVFGKRLNVQPLMRNVLADLALESEAATVLALRLARSFDTRDDEAQALLRRLLTPAAKYWICKRGPAVAAEAMEVLGGNGFVEDGPLARCYRQMPLNSIWEGSGNVMCLDVLRALARDKRCVETLAAEIAPALNQDAHLDCFVARLMLDLRDAEPAEERARSVTQRIALAVQGALLTQFAPDFVARAFCSTRLAAGEFAGGAFGNLPDATDFASILERAWPPA